MQNYFSILLKRIIFFLIPLFTITYQNDSLLCDKIRLATDIDIEQELNEFCQKNKVLCPMVDAINYSLNMIKSYSKTYEIESEDNELKYRNVKSSLLSCKNVLLDIERDENVEEIKDEKYSISFVNCTSKMVGQLLINEIYEAIFISEIYFDKIIFIKRKYSLSGEMNLLFEYNQDLNKTFNYDRNYILFDDELVAKMDIIMENIFMNYTSNFKTIIELDDNQLVSQLKYLSNIINRFAKQYSLFNPEIDTNQQHIITYLGYNQFKYESLINIYNHIYISKLYVNFEYAVNYNITYNEGYFILDYMNFSKIQSKNDVYIGNIRNKTAEFDNQISTEESDLIWEGIKNDFYNKFIKYKTK